MQLGVIADDFTGGTDIAGFLVAEGLATIQLNGVPQGAFKTHADAAVVSLKSRSNPHEEAVRQSLAALRWLKAQGCKRFFFKYCSTFDSTARGNIGPVTDALLGELGETFTVICPALPVNGRTVYCGYLFVNGVPLNESGMRHHPITPMLDASLMRLMEAQASGKAGNVSSVIIDQGAVAVRESLAAFQAGKVRYAVLDALNDRHLTILGQVVADMPFVTGGSGLGAGIARAIAAAGGHEHTEATRLGAPPGGGRAVILSGSCSTMTNAQVAAYLKEAPSFSVDLERCVADPSGYADNVAQWVAEQQVSLAPLIYATTDPEGLAVAQRTYGAEKASHSVEVFFSDIASRLAQRGFDHFIVAGGETSGAVVQSLGVTAFHIGPQIAPGVPWVRAVDAPVSLALKSGNFGDERFFFKAQSFF